MILVIRGVNVILDADVAYLYGVETKRINEAVKNNPDKFPEDYMFALTNEELMVLRSTRSTSNILRSKFSTKSRILPKAVSNQLKVENYLSIFNFTAYPKTIDCCL